MYILNNGLPQPQTREIKDILKPKILLKMWNAASLYMLNIMYTLSYWRVYKWTKIFGNSESDKVVWWFKFVKNPKCYNHPLLPLFVQFSKMKKHVIFDEN